MRGVLLDPGTGRPYDAGRFLGPEEASIEQVEQAYDVTFRRLPPGIRSNLLRSRENRLAGIASPKFGFGPFRQMVDGAIALADQTQITGTAEAGVWPAAQYTGWSANQLRGGQIWYCFAFGIATTAASATTLTITPRYGTTTGGVALGASAATAITTTASSAPWSLEYTIVFRTVGLAGTNSTAVGSGLFRAPVALITAATGNLVPFGSTASVSVDLSIAAGLFMGFAMAGTASNTAKTLWVGLESLN